MSVPTPAIVDSRLIEAPFEVAMRASQARRHDEAEDPRLSATEANGGSADASADASADQVMSAGQRREQRRSVKKAEKEAARLAKREAKLTRAEQKNSSRADPPANSGAARTEPELIAPPQALPAELDVELKPSTPRTASSFDELMGYTQS